jgi:sulfatase maturation enzyme AslB (radical SAM superfamily)
MNPEGAEIVNYFKKINPNINVRVSTNGGARDKKFWQQLAKSDAQVIFALDGLEDTHHLYRQNTSWSTVIKNAKIFIEQGGYAEWQMIRFQHNRHQIKACRKLSVEMGFKSFNLVSDGRDTAPVFEKHGNLSHVLGDYQGEREFKVLFHKKQNDDVLLEDILVDRVPKKKIRCETQRLGSIFIAANGDVSPCCWTGFYPRTYGKGQYHQAANAQLVPLMSKNNALEYSIKECIQWFSRVQGSWDQDSYQLGRLVICDDNCGSDH